MRVVLRIELSREADRRWIAEVLDIPGCLAYGATEVMALSAVKALALRVLAERIEHGVMSLADGVSFVPAVSVLSGDEAKIPPG